MDKKYACFGGPCHMAKSLIIVDAYWLPRWYKIPFEECVFINDTRDLIDYKLEFADLIALTPRNDGKYKEYLAKQKLKHLLEKD